MSNDHLNLANISANSRKPKQLKLIIYNLPNNLDDQQLIEAIGNIDNSDFPSVKLIKQYKSKFNRSNFVLKIL